MDPTHIQVTLAAGASLLALFKVAERSRLSRAKHPSLAGHARISRRLARLVPRYEYDDKTFFCSDHAPLEVEARRRTGFDRLSRLFKERFPRSAAMTREAQVGISDLQFTSAYRVPFQYGRYVSERLQGGSFAHSSSDLTLTDLDGNELYDLTGSYGVNVFGNDFYKECMARGAERVADLGAVLGPYHPAIVYNVERLRAISGLDEVSFHMSGTEAVMQAVRLARFHTRRSHLVRFAGAYHGWWGDVQPGVGNPTPARETYTLRDMDRRALSVLATRRDIACVLVNPLQSLHPNAGAPSDSALVGAARQASFDREAYGRWLKELREVCTRRGIVLIFDEVFMGFRLAPRGAQEYFGVKADMVTYGKTLGGGLPVGVVCGKAALMRRFREDRPTDICFARGTFNSHPHVMGAMQVFLERLESEEIRELYARNGDAVWDGRAREMNKRLGEEGLPVRVANLGSVWTVLYQSPSRYNWMFQYYLRAEGLALSWVGTRRLIFNFRYTDASFAVVRGRFVDAARAMQRDGFFWAPEGATNKGIRRQILGEMLAHRLGLRAA